MSETNNYQQMKELLEKASAAAAAIEGGTMDVYDGLLVSYPIMTTKHPESVVRPLLNQMHVTPHAYHMDNPLGPLVMLKAINTILDIVNKQDKDEHNRDNNIEVFVLNTECDACRLDDTVVQVIYDDFRVLYNHTGHNLSLFFLTREAPSAHGITPQVVLLVKVYPHDEIEIDGGGIADAEGYRLIEQVKEGTYGRVLINMSPLSLPAIPILQWNFTLKPEYTGALIKDLTVKATAEKVAIIFNEIDSHNGNGIFLGGLESSKIDGMKVTFLSDYAKHNNEYGYVAYIMALPDYIIVNGEGIETCDEGNFLLEPIWKQQINHN